MKNKSREAIALLSLFGAFASPVQVHAMPRKDVLECALPGYGRATLTAAYDESVLAKIIPADISKRLNQESWEIKFKPVTGPAAPQPPWTVPYVLGTKACSHIGFVDGVLIINMSFLGADSKWFQAAELPKSLLLSSAADSQPPAIRVQLEAMGAAPVYGYSVILPRGAALVYELALVKFKEGDAGGVVAVFQSKSSDGGVSWSEPQITTQAEIYTLGVPPFAQPFQGRAISLNGKRLP